MPVKRIQVGQVWKKVGTTDTYLITKLYTEALATFVVLRKTGAENEAPLRLKVEHNGPGQTIPGFSFAQESEEF